MTHPWRTTDLRWQSCSIFLVQSWEQLHLLINSMVVRARLLSCIDRGCRRRSFWSGRVGVDSKASIDMRQQDTRCSCELLMQAFCVRTPTCEQLNWLVICDISIPRDTRFECVVSWYLIILSLFRRPCTMHGNRNLLSSHCAFGNMLTDCRGVIVPAWARAHVHHALLVYQIIGVVNVEACDLSRTTSGQRSLKIDGTDFSRNLCQAP